MPAKLDDIVDYCNQLLKSNLYQDYCPNGLQVQGKERVRKIIAGVSASQKLIDQAIASQADLILVHHGYFWKGESPVITGIKRNRLQALLSHNISLLAYHLPLDFHPELGNNAQFSKLMDWPLVSSNQPQLGEVNVYLSKLQAPLSITQLALKLENRLGRKPLLIDAGNPLVSDVAFCTGAAQGYIEQAWQKGAEVFISGEISEQTVHSARELGINYLAAGHHATERYGVKALGEQLSQEFQLDYCFVDINNPV